jgi:hypothetical protein
MEVKKIIDQNLSVSRLAKLIQYLPSQFYFPVTLIVKENLKENLFRKVIDLVMTITQIMANSINITSKIMNHMKAKD